MTQHVTDDVRVRGKDVGVKILVWGWDEFAWNLHLPLLERVEAMALDGYLFGQAEEDMEEDILDRFSQMFCNVEVEIGDADEVEIRLEPVEVLKSPM